MLDASATDDGIQYNIGRDLVQYDRLDDGRYFIPIIDHLYRVDGMLYPYIAPNCIVMPLDWLTRMREHISGAAKEDC